MGYSGFENLAVQFSKLTAGDTKKAQEAMRAAGRAFFDAVTKNRLDLQDISEKLKKKPVKFKKETKRNVRYFDLL